MELTRLEESADKKREADDRHQVENDEKRRVENVDAEPETFEVSQQQADHEQPEHLNVVYGEQRDVVEEAEACGVLELLAKAASFLLDDSREDQRDGDERGEDDEVKSQIVDVRRCRRRFGRRQLLQLDAIRICGCRRGFEVSRVERMLQHQKAVADVLVAALLGDGRKILRVLLVGLKAVALRADGVTELIHRSRLIE